MVRDEVLPTVTQLPGCLGLSMLVERDTGHCVVATSWETQEAMRSTEATVRPMREKAAELFQGEVKVEEWEIAVMHRLHHTQPGAYTRSTWLTMPDITRAHDIFQMVVLPTAEEMPGFCSGVLLINSETGAAVSTITYADKTSLESSRQTAADLRTRAQAESGSTILDVREHELVLAHLHVPELA